MTASLTQAQNSEIVYPSEDGEPLAETYDHVYEIVTTLEVLKQYLEGRQATVLADQFLYYSENRPKLRTAPDVMVIFDIAPGGRDNYKIWEEGAVPAVIFEITSKGTQEQDQSFKKTLYEQLEVQEYWLFDPKGEWIEEKLRGYRLRGDTYELIGDRRSVPLQLRLEAEGKIIGFYREDTGEKLLIADELKQALQEKTEELVQQIQAREEAEERAEQECQRAAKLEAMLARYRERFGDLPE